jgi:hypothetical protein
MLTYALLRFRYNLVAVFLLVDRIESVSINNKPGTVENIFWSAKSKDKKGIRHESALVWSYEFSAHFHALILTSRANHRNLSYLVGATFRVPRWY